MTSNSPTPGRGVVTLEVKLKIGATQANGGVSYNTCIICGKKPINKK